MTWGIVIFPLLVLAWIFTLVAFFDFLGRWWFG